MGDLVAAARTLAKAGDQRAAADLLHAARRELSLPADADILLVEARMMLRSRRPGMSLDALSELLREDPGHLQALRLRARVLASQGDLRGAIADGTVVLERAEPDMDLLRSTLVRLQLIGEWDVARTLMEQHRTALPEFDAHITTTRATLEPDATSAELVAAVLKPAHRDLAEDAAPDVVRAALPLLEADVSEEPDAPRPLERLGAAELRLDEHARAIVTHERLTDLDPLNEAGWFGLAAAHRGRGAWIPAMTSADRALALNPDSHRARMIRVEAGRALGAHPWTDTAADDQARLLLETKDPEITADLAVFLDRDGEHRDAAAMRAMAGQAPDAQALATTVGAIDGLIVYTVVTGGYEQPSDPRDVLGPGADVAILTDDVDALPESMRSIGRPLELDAPAQLASRHPKMLPHLYFPDHERSIYIDANFHLRTDPRPLAQGLSQETPMTVLFHSERTSPLAESLLVVERGFASWGEIRDHFDRQRSAGFDPASSPLSYGGFLARFHGDERLHGAMETWWDQFSSGVRRDQLSLDFSLWNHDIVPRRVAMNNHRNDHWVRIPHV
jgi:tetratricopeptide (TPR) repeat protein